MTRRLAALLAVVAACGPGPVVETLERPPVCGRPVADPSMPVVHIGPDVSVEIPCGSQALVPVASLSEVGPRGYGWAQSIEGDASVFGSSTGPGGMVCAGGGTTVIQISAQAPPAAVPGDTFDATVTILSPDGAFAGGTVHVHVTVVAADFTIEPSDIDFGDLPMGTFRSVAVTFRNPSAGLVIVSTPTTHVPPFTFGTELASLVPGVNTINPLWVDLDVAGERTAQFTWTSTMKSGPLSPACAVTKTAKVHVRGVPPAPGDGGAPDAI